MQTSKIDNREPSIVMLPRCSLPKGFLKLGDNRKIYCKNRRYSVVRKTRLEIYELEREKLVYFMLNPTQIKKTTKKLLVL